MGKKNGRLFLAGAACATAAALASAACAGSCIISGSTERTFADEAWAEALDGFDSRDTVDAFGAAFSSFDSRWVVLGMADPLPKFKSTPPTGSVILVR